MIMLARFGSWIWLEMLRAASTTTGIVLEAKSGAAEGSPAFDTSLLTGEFSIAKSLADGSLAFRSLLAVRELPDMSPFDALFGTGDGESVGWGSAVIAGSNGFGEVPGLIVGAGRLASTADVEASALAGTKIRGGSQAPLKYRSQLLKYGSKLKISDGTATTGEYLDNGGIGRQSFVLLTTAQVI